MQTHGGSFYTVKVPDGDGMDCVLARKDIPASDGLGNMSKQHDSADCEYSRRLRERVSAEQSTFICGGTPQS